MTLFFLLISLAFGQPYLSGYDFQVSEKEITVYDYENKRESCLVIVTYPDKEVCYTLNDEFTLYFYD